MTSRPADERVFVGLGANLGAARAAVEAALVQLAALPGTALVARSAPYRSAPVDAGGPDFINAVAELRTALQPQELLHALLAIEQAHGRERPYHHAPRTLDLDLLLYGQQVLHTPTLTLPHPRLHQRAFVLLPLLELAPDLQHPALGALAAYRAATAHQPIERLP
jgi:2-amino-4-hydroxy-6-hydroxymethyldihydropteridine diphosphokinase